MSVDYYSVALRDETKEIYEQAAKDLGRTIEDLLQTAVEEAAINYKHH